MRKMLVHPSDHMREAMDRYVPKPIVMSRSVAAVTDRMEQVDGLARLIEMGLEHATSGDGRLDLRKMAAFMLDTMDRNQKQ